MVKRKAHPPNGTKPSNTGDESSGDSDTGSLLDVDFEWFDIQEIDFHGLKLLLRQLFDVDSELFDLSALAELIVLQNAVGSTVKVPEDDTETMHTDPFAFLTVLSLRQENQILRTLSQYLANKASSIPMLSGLLPALLSPSVSPNAHVGLILNERLVNMPAEIIPPMYKMLLSEISAAVQESHPYDFTHYLIASKTYSEIASQLAAMDLDSDDDSTGTTTARPQKKNKKTKNTVSKGKSAATGATGTETFYFHPEDEIWQKHALGYGNYEYSKPWADGAGDSKRAFQEAGIRPCGHLILVEAARFREAVEAVERYINPGVA